MTNLYQYDRLNRLTNAVWKLNTTTVGSFFYKLNLSGVRTNLDEALNGSRSYAWQYDPLYRMTNENISAVGALGRTGIVFCGWLRVLAGRPDHDGDGR